MKPIRERIIMATSVGLQSNDSTRRTSYAQIVLWCAYSYSARGNLLDRSTEARLLIWGEFFVGLAQEHFDDLQKEASKTPDLNIFLILTGLGSPEDALASAVEGGISEGNLLFTSSNSWLRGRIPTITGFFARRLIVFDAYELAPQPDLDRVAHFFTKAAREFLSENKVVSEDFFGPFFIPSVDLLPKAVIDNKVLLGAVMLCALSALEIMISAGFSHQRISQLAKDDPITKLYRIREGTLEEPVSNWFKENLEDDWLLGYLVDWAARENSIYAKDLE